MLRKAVWLCAGACVALLAFACERKAPEEAPVVTVKRPVQAPQGMTRLPVPGNVFITPTPIAVGNYVAYLRGTDQPVPTEWEGIREGVPGAELPVRGLGRQDAESYATWAMKRLPTMEEWGQAAAVVGQRPYPWTGDDPSTADAEFFLIRDWTTGSDAERAARQRKDQLPARLLETQQARVAALREQLSAAVATAEAQRDALWKDVKPAFFALLDVRKDLAERRETERRRGDAADILKNILFEKGNMAARLKMPGVTAQQEEEALQAYDRLLGQTLAELSALRGRTEDQMKETVARTNALTATFEGAGSARLGELPESVTSALRDTLQTPATLKDAIARRVALEQALALMEGQPPAFDAMPSAQALADQAAQLRKELDGLPTPDALKAEIADLRTRMQLVGESIGKEFLREAALFDELDKVVELGARHEGLRAKLTALEAAVGKQG